MNLKNFFGDRKFYKTVFAVAVPIMIQNGITNFVALLDNIMVGQLGTEQMSGTAVTNQLLFVYNLCVFGLLAGPGIFGAQFYGKGSNEGVRQVFRFKIIIGAIALFGGAAILSLFGDGLINSYLTGDGQEGDRALIFASAKEYLNIMLIGLIPFTVSQIYASTLRETGCTVPPMYAGMGAVLINLLLDWVLIFGRFGLPEMGVRGAALATVIARFAECGAVVIYTHASRGKNEFIKGAYKSLAVPLGLVKKIIISGLPLAVNEFFWSSGMAKLNQCYSQRGLEVVAATNISSTILNIFNVVYIALGSAVGIIVGQILGSGDMKKARDTDTKLIAFSIAAGAFTGLIMAAFAGVFPELYNTTDEVKALAGYFIRILALFIPLHAFMNAAYFTLRSGGQTFITLLFDSVFMWVVSVPTALLLVTYTGLDIKAVYFICQSVDIIKVAMGIVFLKKGVWLKNIVGD
ncbi:MAG: MATE family efflux transporter [Oscillospiraceae bacterium]|nr:MATE family efflux transporter [Oscillospiraceae bacterium]